MAQSSNKSSSSISPASNSKNHLNNPSAVWIHNNIQVKPNKPDSGNLKRCQNRSHKNKNNKETIQPNTKKQSTSRLSAAKKSPSQYRPCLTDGLRGWAEGIKTYKIRLDCTVIRYIQYLQYLIVQPPEIRLVCTILRYIQYLQYLIPQPPVRLKVDKKSITIFKLIHHLLYTHRSIGRNLQNWRCLIQLVLQYCIKILIQKKTLWENSDLLDWDLWPGKQRQKEYKYMRAQMSHIQTVHICKKIRMMWLYMKDVRQQMQISHSRTDSKDVHSLVSQMSSHASVSFKRLPPRDRWSLTSILVPLVSNPAM